MPNEPFSAVPEQLQRQFEQLGQELGVVMLEQFKAALLTERQTIEKTLETLVTKQREKILKQVQKELENSIFEQFGKESNVLSLMSEGVLNRVFNRLGRSTQAGTPILPGFRQSNSQQMASFWRLAQRALSRY